MKPRHLLFACGALTIGALLISFIPEPHPVPRQMTLGEALDNGIVEADIKSLGGHTGGCVSGTFRNTQDQPIEVMVEPGRRLVTVDEGLQDILVTREMPVILAGNQTGTVVIDGFCMQVSNDSPKMGADFTTGYMAQPQEQELAKFLNKGNFPKSPSQSAVWSVANGKDINTIHYHERDSIDDLIHFVAQLKGVEVPKYTIKHKDTEDELFSGIPTSFQATVAGRFNEPTNVHVVLYRGVKSIRRDWVEFEGKSGIQRKEVEMDIEGLPRGKYMLRAFDRSSNRIEEYPVVI